LAEEAKEDHDDEMEQSMAEWSPPMKVLWLKVQQEQIAVVVRGLKLGVVAQGM
jgi:hypothetical protein